MKRVKFVRLKNHEIQGCVIEKSYHNKEANKKQVMMIKLHVKMIMKHVIIIKNGV